MYNELQKQEPVTHEWWSVGLNASDTRRLIRCGKCFEMCVIHYASHTRGWTHPKKYYSRCPHTLPPPPQQELFA